MVRYGLLLLLFVHAVEVVVRLTRKRWVRLAGASRAFTTFTTFTEPLWKSSEVLGRQGWSYDALHASRKLRSQASVPSGCPVSQLVEGLPEGRATE